MTTATLSASMCAERRPRLYAPGMAKRVLVSVQELRRTIGKLTESVERQEHVVLSKRGKPFAVTVPIDWYRTAAAAVNDPTDY